MTTLKFLYFDLGKVLVDFDIHRMVEQIAAAAGASPERVYETLFRGELQREYETGAISTEEFYEAFCRRIGTRAAPERLLAAFNEMFDLNVDMVPVVAQLAAAGWPMGVLSNTCEAHWEYCIGRFRLLTDGLFRVHVRSYEVGAMKPDPAIFQAAAERAGVRPREIFYTDDTPGHVEGARAAGFDAVVYTSTPELVGDLRKRGVRFNY
jgi:glucose-1-phosphatase